MRTVIVLLLIAGVAPAGIVIDSQHYHASISGMSGPGCSVNGNSPYSGTGSGVSLSCSPFDMHFTWEGGQVGVFDYSADMGSSFHVDEPMMVDITALHSGGPNGYEVLVDNCGSEYDLLARWGPACGYMDHNQVMLLPGHSYGVAIYQLSDPWINWDNPGQPFTLHAGAADFGFQITEIPAPVPAPGVVPLILLGLAASRRLRKRLG
jgi:hypothetical protein